MADVVPEFLEAARAFRSALATEEQTEKEAFARRLRNALAQVYLAAARLPRHGPVTTEDTQASTRDRKGSQALEERIRARFGHADTFVDVWDPTDREARAETIERSLALELVEIDEDLADSIVWLEDAPSPNALWDAWFAFEEHWGKHAVDVLRPLHHIARGDVG